MWGGLGRQPRRDLCGTGLFWSFEKFLKIILTRRRPDLKEGARPSWLSGETACWTGYRSSPLQWPFMTKQCKMAAPELCEWIPPDFQVVGYTCSLFNRSGTPHPPPPFCFQLFSAVFTSAHSLVFPTLPISLFNILSCIIHEWHACFTCHILTTLLWRPEGVSTKPACNLLTHGAASSQLSSPITFISWIVPLPDTKSVVIRVLFIERQTERRNATYVCGSRGEVIGWVLNAGGSAANG